MTAVAERYCAPIDTDDEYAINEMFRWQEVCELEPGSSIPIDAEMTETATFLWSVYLVGNIIEACREPYEVPDALDVSIHQYPYRTHQAGYYQAGHASGVGGLVCDQSR